MQGEYERRKTIPSSRTAQEEDTRRRLRAAGRRWFRANGVETVSMEEIANADIVGKDKLLRWIMRGEMVNEVLK